jgi:hypothetical protein
MMRKNQPEAVERADQKSLNLKWLCILTKWFPVVFNVIMALDSAGCAFRWWHFSGYIYTLTGSCLFFSVPVCAVCSRIFGLCKWHRILVWSMASALILETLRAWNIIHYAYVANERINVYIWGVLFITAFGLLTATIIYAHERKGRKQSKKSPFQVLDENRVWDVRHVSRAGLCRFIKRDFLNAKNRTEQ